MKKKFLMTIIATAFALAMSACGEETATYVESAVESAIESTVESEVEGIVESSVESVASTNEEELKVAEVPSEEVEPSKEEETEESSEAAETKETKESVEASKATTEAPKESKEVASKEVKEETKPSTSETKPSTSESKPAEEKPVATPTPTPTPEPTPVPTPAPETPSTPPSEDEEVDIDSLWGVIDSGMSWNESEHTIIRVLQNAYTCETKDESYSEAHTWVDDEKVLVTNPYGEDYWGIPRHCSVCGYADGHVEPIE